MEDYSSIILMSFDGSEDIGSLYPAMVSLALTSKTFFIYFTSRFEKIHSLEELKTLLPILSCIRRTLAYLLEYKKGNIHHSLEEWFFPACSNFLSKVNMAEYNKENWKELINSHKLDKSAITALWEIAICLYTADKLNNCEITKEHGFNSTPFTKFLYAIQCEIQCDIFPYCAELDTLKDYDDVWKLIKIVISEEFCIIQWLAEETEISEFDYYFLCTLVPNIENNEDFRLWEIKNLGYEKDSDLEEIFTSSFVYRKLIEEARGVDPNFFSWKEFLDLFFHSMPNKDGQMADILNDKARALLGFVGWGEAGGVNVQMAKEARDTIMSQTIWPFLLKRVQATATYTFYNLN
mgnify:CR=1 FL=1